MSIRKRATARIFALTTGAGCCYYTSDCSRPAPIIKIHAAERSASLRTLESFLSVSKGPEAKLGILGW